MTPYERFRGLISASIRKKYILIAVCAVGMFIGCGLELSVDQYRIGFFRSWELLIDCLCGVVHTEEPLCTMQHVIWEWRVPRMIATMCTGAALGIAGAAMQCALKNVMADPYITGISTGASFGASLIIIGGVGTSFMDTGSLILSAFVFSLIPMGIVLLVSAFKNMSPTEIILVAVAISYVFEAASSIIRLVATEEELADIFYWNQGTLGAAAWSNVPIIAAASVFGIIALILISRGMNTLYVGDETARTLGVNTKRMRISALLIVSFMVACSVAFVGPIGFVGLVAPHACRLLIGSDNRYLFPASMVLGATMLLLTDTASKMIGITGIPVGIMTSLIGGPLFLWLLIGRGKKHIA